MEATTACSKDSPGTMNSDTDEHDSVLELGLGLTLATGTGSHSGGVKFLTAQDLPSVTPHCSSLRRKQTQGRHLGFQASISGTKRASPATPSSPPSLSQVVGWPPIRSYRMNNLASQTRATNAEDEKRSGECGNKKMNTKNNANNDGKAKTPAVQGNARLGFVKVNMDGVQIGRKVDLNAHSCYESLAKTVEDMFFKPCVDSVREFQSSSKLLDGSSEFVLTYEDKEGDWMLVGDVPFRMFIGTVKRLRIMRTSEANGLAPRSQERNDGPRSKPVCS